MQKPEQPVRLVHEHRGIDTTPAQPAALRVPPPHELAQGGRARTDRVVVRSDGLDGGQRVREALIVEEWPTRRSPFFLLAHVRHVRTLCTHHQ
jgi:hypothetical protein